MKSINNLWILLLVSMLIACGGGSSADSDKTTAKTYDTGSITLSLGGGIQSRMISPNWTEVRYYDIFGFGPDEKTFEKLGVDKNLDEVTISDIASGEWTIQVTAKDIFNNDEILGSGETTVTVQRGVTSSAEIVVKPLTGNGTLSLRFSWNKDYISNPVIVAELVNSANQTIVLPLDMDDTLAAASYSSEQGPGYYTLLVRLYDGEELLTGYTETVRILQGLTSSGGHWFDQVTEPVGNLALSFIEDMNQSLPVSLGSDDLSLRLGESTTFTATVNEEINNPNYQWYLNGSLQPEITGTTFTLTSDFNKVDYVAVVVKSEDSTRYGDSEIRMATSEMKYDLRASFENGWAFSSRKVDIDQDNDLDIVMAGVNGAPTIFYNVDGHFEYGNTIDVLSGTRDIAVADLNNDTRPDLIVSEYYNDQKVWIYYQQEDGSFNESSEVIGLTDVRYLELGDIDLDGDLDLIANVRTTGVQIYVNTDGQFTNSGQSFNESQVNASSILLADFNDDGNLDIFASYYSNKADQLLINNGSGVFTLTQEIGSAHTQHATAGDLDGDGDLDIVVANYSGQVPMVYLNDGHAQFTAGFEFPSGATIDVSVADLDADGDLDVLQTNQLGGSRIWLNKGDATFSDSLLRLNGREHFTSQIADFDEDGDLDIMLGNRYNPIFQLFDYQK